MEEFKFKSNSKVTDVLNKINMTTSAYRILSFSSSSSSSYLYLYLYFAQSPTRKRSTLQSTIVICTTICYGFVVTCFLMGKQKFIKNSRVREYSRQRSFSRISTGVSNEEYQCNVQARIRYRPNLRDLCVI
jgi:hypothetical protein